MTKRNIFIGDVHGCFDELVELLDVLEVRPQDEVISVGDLIAKGPESVACVELWRARGFKAVLGNNEVRLLKQVRKSGATDNGFAARPDLVGYLASLPRHLLLPEIDTVVVHGGVLPEMSLDEANLRAHRDEIVKLRYLRFVGGIWVPVKKGTEKESDTFWPSLWRGPMTVVYGHTPSHTPRIDSHAIGIDTGCVFGNTLSAAIHDGVRWSVVSVQARDAYAQHERFSRVIAASCGWQGEVATAEEKTA